jgi:subfamily B ATP-binding cassette protein MsbA
MANSDISVDEISRERKLRALYRVAVYRPLYTAGVVTLTIVAAVFEGVGLSFILPVLNSASDSANAPAQEGRVMEAFVSVFEFFNVPFALEYIIAGLAVVMILRYSLTFLVSWLRVSLQTGYVRHLQTEGFNNAIDANVSYFDAEGSDDILNAIVTQSYHAGKTIDIGVGVIKQILMGIMYLGIALFLAPLLTVLTVVFLGFVTVFIRYFVKPGYTIGERVADANERIQETAQAGTQGIRDVKLFTLESELRSGFQTAVSQYETARVNLQRNKAALDNFHQLVVSLTVFILIYFAFTFTEMSVGAIGVFLFAMFRLAPRASTLNNMVYNLEGNLPHLVRTQDFITELVESREADTGDTRLPETIERVAFDDVSFSYPTGEQALENVSFHAEGTEFVAFVGPSGAGKSTIISLLARLYTPDSGQITANGESIAQFPLDEWRERVAVVRQSPFIFNDTLRYNVTIGNRSASQAEIERACEIAQITEFLDELPNGFDTVLGDDGVRLSGGQRQRISIARALLTDADVLVLDEATSDLDSGIEEEVHHGIESAEADRLLLAISHRFSTVINADRIYMLEDGQIAEIGTHDELVERDGAYAELYQAQS